MADISIKQLQAFVHVADLGSFRRAADRLNTTQPNISARIAGLETRLGLRLMQRDAGSVRLTARGEHLLLRARAVLHALDEFVGAADDDTLFDGVLRLGVTEMIVHSWLGPCLRALKQRFPNVLIDLTVDLSANLSGALFSRGLDLALQSGPFNRQATGSVALGRYPYIWVASPDLGIADRVLALQDLAAHPLLTHARGTLPFEQLAEHVSYFPDVQVRLVASTNMVACLQMTMDGLGIACLPRAMVRRELAEGALVSLRYLWVPDDLAFWARYDASTAPLFVAEAARIARQVATEFQDSNP